MSALHRSLILLNLQRQCPIGFVDNLGLRATTAILALNEVIIGFDRNSNDTWILVTFRTYLLLVDTLRSIPIFKGKLGFLGYSVKDSQSQPRRLELSPNHRMQIESETKAPISFNLARFNVDIETSVIRTVAGPFEVIWDMEKVLAGQKAAYTISRCEGRLETAGSQNDSDEQAGVLLSDVSDDGPSTPEIIMKRLQSYRERIIYETVTAEWLGRAASLEPSQALDEHLVKIQSMLQQLEEEAEALNSFEEFCDP